MTPGEMVLAETTIGNYSPTAWSFSDLIPLSFSHACFCCEHFSSTHAQRGHGCTLMPPQHARDVPPSSPRHANRVCTGRRLPRHLQVLPAGSHPCPLSARSHNGMHPSSMVCFKACWSVFALKDSTYIKLDRNLHNRFFTP